MGCFAATKEFKKRVRKLFRFAICCNHATRFSIDIYMTRKRHVYMYKERDNFLMYHLSQMFIMHYAACYLQNEIAKFVPPEKRFFTNRR